MNSRNYMKTTLLLAAMSAIVLFIGSQIRGGAYLPLALAFAILMNGVAYFFSDKIAILSARAKPVTESEYPELYRIVRGLAGRAGMPMPKLYVSPSQQPNAFATGRNPKHAAVAVTQGILPILTSRELEGVLAHELSHVRNRDILISSVAATMGAIIMFLARLAWFIPLGGDRDRNPLAELALLILGPIAALLIQMAVTRSREFGADSSGARLTADPLALANALRKIEAHSRGTMPATSSPSTAHLFISNPFKFSGGGMAKLFSTHPPTAERVARLEAMAYDPYKRP